jgi:AcrR family transcriptional regulator
LERLGRLDPGALTIQAICQDAQVTAPTLYYHFGSKDGVIAAAVERLAQTWIDMLDRGVPRRGDLDETLATAEQGWHAMVVAPGRPLAVMCWVTLLVADASDTAREALVAARDRTVELTRDALLPHLSDPAAAHDLAALVIDGVVAAALEHHLDGDDAALRRRLATVSHVVRAVVTTPGPTATV